MAMSALYGLVTICLFGIASAVTLPGPCPDIQTMPDFKLHRFLGKWYEQKRYFKESERDAKCVSGFYTSYNGSTVEFVHFKIKIRNGKPVSMKGSLSQSNPAQPGQLVMNFYGRSFEGKFWILRTNYDDFAVIYSCTNKESSHVQSAWILTRKQHPSNDIVKRALKVVKEHNINEKPFIDTDQINCPVWME